MFTEEFQNWYVLVTGMRLLFFPFPKGNELPLFHHFSSQIDETKKPHPDQVETVH